MTTTAFLHEFDATVIEHGIISISNRLEEGIDQKDLTKIGRALCTYAYIKEEIPIELSKKHKLPPKVVAAEKLMLAWQQSLYVGDSADIYDEQYDTFYEGKITSRTGNIISVHFLGWKGFDIDVDITVTPIYPINTITVPKRKASDGLVNTATQQSSAIIEPTEVVDEAEIKPTITTASGRTVKLKMAPIAEVKPVRDPNKKKETILELDGRECNTDDNEFLCFECGFLEHPAKSDMVLCDGACLRTAHYLCLSPVDKKSYDSLVDKEADAWLCHECASMRHHCFICKGVGDDFLEVNNCSQPKCGKFYHTQCLLTCPTILKPTIKFASKQVEELYLTQIAQTHKSESKSAVGSTITSKVQSSSARQAPGSLTEETVDVSSKPAKSRSKKSKDVEASMDETNLDIYENYVHPPPAPLPQTAQVKALKLQYNSKGMTKAFTFKCPYHMCHNCYPIYGSNGTPDLKCSYCPRAYHENCLPPRTRFNTLVMACSIHSSITLPGEKSVKTDEDDSTKIMTGDVNYSKIFADVVLPKDPKVTDTAELHYRLPSDFPDDIKAEPRPFKAITRLRFDQVNLSDLSFDLAESVCSCVGECGLNCMNRQVKIECNDDICSLGSKCGNRRLQNMDYAKTIRFPEFEMGWGLKAGELIPEGALVIEYIGEVIDRDEMKKRMFNQRQNTPSDKDYYIMALEGIFYVDGKHYGSDSRFINHSCDPNCELQLWRVNGRQRIGICAVREIQPDEPLSYDYQFETSEENVFKCYCKTAACRGTMAPKKKPTHHSLSALGTNAKRAMVEEYRRKASRKTREQMVEEEICRSLTSKYLPGDKIHAIRDGPVPSNMLSARAHGIFLPRNAIAGSNFEKRRRLYYGLSS